MRPTDRVVFEELRQLAVFLPLVLVPIAFINFSYIAAAVAFLVALPVMALLNKMLKRAIRTQGMKMRERDGGRFAFTTFMCKEFGLHPQDVTMALVLKMCEDFKLWIAAANRVHQRDEAEAHARKEAAQKAAASAKATGKAWATGAAVAGAGAALSAVAATYDAVPTINPATGLPMIDGVLDVHGNVFGTSSVDDMFHDVYYEYSVDTNFTHIGADYNTSEFSGFAPGSDGYGID
jgi:hypothetical protein